MVRVAGGVGLMMWRRALVTANDSPEGRVSVGFGLAAHSLVERIRHMVPGMLPAAGVSEREIDPRGMAGWCSNGVAPRGSAFDADRAKRLGNGAGPFAFSSRSANRRPRRA